jgi:hypothetical protein
VLTALSAPVITQNPRGGVLQVVCSMTRKGNFPASHLCFITRAILPLNISLRRCPNYEPSHGESMDSEIDYVDDISAHRAWSLIALPSCAPLQ